MFYHETEDGYELDIDGLYYSKRYDKSISVELGFCSDGATGAIDIFSSGWWFHDKVCNTGLWMDGTRLTNWKASFVLADILWKEKRQFRAVYWFILTFIFGGGEARKNGMFKLKQ